MVAAFTLIYCNKLGLCGPPLTQNCPEDGTTQDDGMTRGSSLSDHMERDDDVLRSPGFFISYTINM